MPPGPNAVPLGVAVRLAHALVQDVGTRRETRVLHIKGPVAEAQGVRGAKVSSDVDVLVDPARVGEVELGLQRAGWRRRAVTSFHALHSAHAVSLLHPEWPCDIDLHVRFPGFALLDRDVFERMWETRASISIGAVECQVPSVAATALVLALHGLRGEARYDGHASALVDLQHRIEAEFDSAFLEDLAVEAVRLGCDHTASPFLRELGVRIADSDDASPEAREWDARRREGFTLASDLAFELRRVPWWRRPVLMIRVAWPSRRDISIASPVSARSPGSRLSYRVNRMARALRDARGARRALRSARRDGTGGSG